MILLQNCPEAVHGLMLKCWEKEHIRRPRFKDILATMDQWIESPKNVDKLEINMRDARFVWSKYFTFLSLTTF